jgi:hypothetical protein
MEAGEVEGLKWQPRNTTTDQIIFCKLVALQYLL